MTPVRSRIQDPVGRTQTILYSALLIAAAAVGYQSWQSGNTTAVLIYGALLLLLGFQAWSANSMRTADLTLDDGGIRRTGSWGWKLGWEKVGSATVEEFKDQPYLVVLRTDPGAPNHNSSTWLWGSPFPRNALVTPLHPAQVPAVEAALASRGLPGPS